MFSAAQKNYLPELHPAQQGLKHELISFPYNQSLLPELHPAQQGLKPLIVGDNRASRLTSRTTSSTTRIETT